MNEITKCECGKEAIVGLNGTWVCLDCFDRDLVDIGKLITHLAGGQRPTTLFKKE